MPLTGLEELAWATPGYHPGREAAQEVAADFAAKSPTEKSKGRTSEGKPSKIRPFSWSGRQDLNLRPLGPERRLRPAHPFHTAAHGRKRLMLLHLRRSKNRTQLPIVRLGCRRGLRADCETRTAATRPGLRPQPREPRCTTFPQSSSRCSSRPAPTWRPRPLEQARRRSKSRRSSGEQETRRRRSRGHQVDRTGDGPPHFRGAFDIRSLLDYASL